MEEPVQLTTPVRELVNTILSKEEAVASVEITKPDVALIELDKVPETTGKSGLIYRPDSNRNRQQNQAESGYIRKMYEPAAGQAEVDSSYWRSYQVGDRVTFMDYAAPQGTFQKYPELRFIGLPDIIAKLNTTKPIVD